MKKIIGLSVAAILTVGTAHAANATTATATTVKTTSTTTKTVAVFPATAQQFTLKDGTFLTVDGQTAWTVDANGVKQPETDGEYTLTDGKSITVKNGLVLGGPAGKPARRRPRRPR